VRHVYECPMRWADLDMLGHVNNVVYVDYLQEARVDLLRSLVRRESDQLNEGVVVVRHEVTYLAPLTFRFRPVKIECWVTEIRSATFTMAYEVFHDDGEDGRVVYLRASTVLSPYVFGGEHPRRLTAEEKAALADFVEPLDPPRPAADRFSVERTETGHYPVHVRFSDVDVYGHVNNVKYFEYLQESRIRWFAALARDLDLPRMHFVVAQTDVDYRLPILLRPDPYDCWTRLGGFGRRSMTVESEICDGDTVLARARVTTVFFDLDAQRSVEPPAALAARLRELTRAR
jgi:acyl-CoA thioester hydrolase